MAGSRNTYRASPVLTPIVALLLVACTPATRSGTPSMTPAEALAPFGTLASGQAVQLFTLRNAHGIQLQFTNYGGIITSLKTPDRNGHFADIVLGYDNLAAYVANSPYFGAIVGRYANRIARGHFTLDGTTYTLAVNNGPNSLHGGLHGFDKVVWNARPFQNQEGQAVTLDYTSPNGEEGYPGTLHATVTYTLTPDDRLIVDYAATTDKATPINLSQHSYWNLAGGASRDILGHLLTINANATTPVDSTLIPTGEIAPVEGTPFDFRKSTPIGARIDAADEQIKNGQGYDHNWVLNRTSTTEMQRAARVYEPNSGRTLEVSTTEPGMQFYTGNSLDGKLVGKSGRPYIRRSGFCLETQHYPDTPNHPNFPTTLLRPGERYHTKTAFTFGVSK